MKFYIENMFNKNSVQCQVSLFATAVALKGVTFGTFLL